MLFLANDEALRQKCEQELARIIREEGQNLLGWRTVPVENSTIGETARNVEPYIRQVFVAKNPAVGDKTAFERKLYIIRKRAENEVRAGLLQGGGTFYFPSFSCRTIVYKGMLIPEQVAEYYPILTTPPWKRLWR